MILKVKSNGRLNLKREAQGWEYPGLQRRFRQTVRFVQNIERQPVLDIGPGNAFGKELSKRFHFEYYYTDGDLDISWSPAVRLKYGTVLCFEVLEHLKNPDKFLRDLQYHLTPGAIVFLSWPRHWFKWSPTHFHEYDELRARELFEGAGYRILDKRTHLLLPEITGVRPVFRAFNPAWMGKQYFYLIQV